jgi:hypothetical protein
MLRRRRPRRLRRSSAPARTQPATQSVCPAPPGPAKPRAPITARGDKRTRPGSRLTSCKRDKGQPAAHKITKIGSTARRRGRIAADIWRRPRLPWSGSAPATRSGSGPSSVAPGARPPGTDPTPRIRTYQRVGYGTSLLYERLGRREPVPGHYLTWAKGVELARLELATPCVQTFVDGAA